MPGCTGDGSGGMARKMISRNESELDEQLVNLFRNRAQLKKAYLELQDQCASLKDQLRNSQASTRRAEERLEAIERLTEAGIPTGVMVAPVIPGLNDHEIPRIVAAGEIKHSLVICGFWWLALRRPDLLRLATGPRR